MFEYERIINSTFSFIRQTYILDKLNQRANYLGDSLVLSANCYKVGSTGYPKSLCDGLQISNYVEPDVSNAYNALKSSIVSLGGVQFNY